jgi:hypothetical protein
MKIFRLAALGAALLYLSDASRRAKLRERVLGLIGAAREKVDVQVPGDVNVTEDLEQRVRTAQAADGVESPSETSETQAPTSTS